MYDDLRTAYQKSALPAIQIGSIFVDDKLITDGAVYLVLKTLNRHGLISGATGTGKTKTMQVLCEQLSLQGVPTLLMDIKGDVSGIAKPGVANDLLIKRSQSLNLQFEAKQFPVELLSLGDPTEGVPIRATIHDFGPMLLARVLELNNTQESVLAVVFDYAKQKKTTLVGLEDLRSLLAFAQTEEGISAFKMQYGAIAPSSLGTIMRKIIALETQVGSDFFCEPAFNCLDLCRQSEQGLGVISVVRLLKMQDKPELISNFMLKLLSDLYRVLPESGDLDKPKLVLFLDEAHLLFDNANKALLNLMDTIIKLIRSKGVGIIFCTQSPNDIPESILNQLGLKIQHALRAFTAKDRKAIKLMAQNFPMTEYYSPENQLTSLGIGDAFVSGLDAKGQPTPLIACRIRPPESRMGVLTVNEVAAINQASSLYGYYKQPLESHAKAVFQDQKTKENSASQQSTMPPLDGAWSVLTKNTLFRQIVRQLVRDFTRVIMSMLKRK